MPFYRQQTNKVAKTSAVTFLAGAVFAMAIGYVGYSIHSARKQLDSITKYADELSTRIGVIERAVAEKESQIMSIDKKFQSESFALEERILALESKKDVDNSQLIESTIKVEILWPFGKQTSSGSIIYSEPAAGDVWVNYALCAAHGFKLPDYIDVPTTTALPFIKIVTYQNISGDVYAGSSYEGRVVTANADLRVAIVYFESILPLPAVKIANESTLEQLCVLSDVFTVGSPLDLPPVITYGKLQNKHIGNRDLPYWLITSNAFMGNSGGGVYLMQNNALVGTVDSVAGAMLPEGVRLPISYLVFINPVKGLREWFEKENLGFINEKQK